MVCPACILPLIAVGTAGGATMSTSNKIILVILTIISILSILLFFGFMILRPCNKNKCGI